MFDIYYVSFIRIATSRAPPANALIFVQYNRSVPPKRGVYEEKYKKSRKNSLSEIDKKSNM